MNSDSNPTASAPSASASTSSNPNPNAVSGTLASGASSSDRATGSNNKRGKGNSNLRPLLPSQVGPIRTVRTGALARSTSDPSTPRGRGRPRRSGGRGRRGDTDANDDTAPGASSSTGAGPSTAVAAPGQTGTTPARPLPVLVSVSAVPAVSAADDGTVYVEAEPPLGRGAACLPCRRKRARCDALRPMCTRCQKGKTGETCKYEEPQKSTLALLKEELERQSRVIKEMTAANASSSSPAAQIDAPAPSSGDVPREDHSLPDFAPRPASVVSHPTRARAATFSGSSQADGYGGVPSSQSFPHQPFDLQQPNLVPLFPSAEFPPTFFNAHNTASTLPPSTVYGTGVMTEQGFHPVNDFGAFAGGSQMDLTPANSFPSFGSLEDPGIHTFPSITLPFVTSSASPPSHAVGPQVQDQGQTAQWPVLNHPIQTSTSADSSTALPQPLRSALHKSTPSALVGVNPGPSAPKRHVSFHESTLFPKQPATSVEMDRHDMVAKRANELFAVPVAGMNQPSMGTIHELDTPMDMAMGDIDISSLLNLPFPAGGGLPTAHSWPGTGTFARIPNLDTAASTSHVQDPTRVTAEEHMELMTRPPLDVRGASKKPDPSWMNGDEPTIEFQSELIKIFLRHRRQFASEIDVQRFIERMQKPEGSTQRPHPAFVNAIFLLACGINIPYDMSEHEQLFLSKAQKALPQSFAGLDRLLDSARAAALLSLYHYARGDMLQGYDCIARAAAIGRSCGLDQIKSHVWRDPTFPEKQHQETVAQFAGRFTLTAFLIPLSPDPRELGERIHAFWSIWILDASGSATTGRDRIFDDSKILTPLPLALVAYSNGTANDSNGFTLAHFWRTEGLMMEGQGFDPPFTHRIKATACLEAVTDLARLAGINAMGDVWNDEPKAPIEPLTTNDFQERYSHVARTVSRVADSLPKVDKSTPLNEEPDVMLKEDWRKAQLDPVMIHAEGLTLCALMVLHEIKAPVDEEGESGAINAAVDVVRLCKRIKDLDFIHLDIMLGMAWVTACHVLLRHARAIQDTQPVEQLVRDVNLIIFSLNKLGKIFPLVEIQALRVSHDLHDFYGF